MAKSICLFNHKGGVSKTTTTFNLGWTLADKGKKVLIVDLDSQCNLTGLVLGYNSIDESYMESFYASRNNLTIQPMVSSLIGGIPPERFMEVDQGSVTRTSHENMFLLPGHLDIADLDSQISVALKVATGIPATRNIPSGLPKILQLLSENINIDYMLYDLSPNVGGLNEVMLMSSDYFIVPASPDYFCLQSISSLEKNIPKWKDEIDQFKRLNRISNNDYAIKNRPQFLGTIQQRYRPRSGRPGTSFQTWIDKIRESINDKLIPALEKINCTISREKVNSVLNGSGLIPYDLAHISDFNSLIAISQQLSKPIFALTNDEIHNTGKVFGFAQDTMQQSRDNFAETFDELGNRILALTE